MNGSVTSFGSAQPPKPWIYLAGGGQSNLLVRGTEAASLSRTPNPNIQIWNHTDTEWQTWDLATNTTQILGQLNGGNGPTNNAYCLVWVMANHLLDRFRVRCFIEAEGAQTIDAFLGSGNHIVRLDAQITAAGVSKIDAVPWHQGEADRFRSSMIYQADMNTFLTELNGYSWFHEDSVFIAGELAEPGSAATPSTSEQNDAIRRFTTENTQARLARTAWAVSITKGIKHGRFNDVGGNSGANSIWYTIPRGGG